MSYNENLNYNEEIWKPVYLEEFKHLYEVSNHGNVRKENHIKKPYLKKGYKYLTLTNKNKRKHKIKEKNRSRERKV